MRKDATSECAARADVSICCILIVKKLEYLLLHDTTKKARAAYTRAIENVKDLQKNAGLPATIP